jgi:phosphoribosylamine---glycine ligase
MNVLLVGSGGREHAIAWKLAQSPRLTKLYVAPGNPGTAALGENVAVKVDDHAAVLRFCTEMQIDLVIVGPEASLAAGLADDLSAAGIKVFGPSRAAAQVEASKVFSKDFMQRHGIPTARYATFYNVAEALAYLDRVDYPVVLKASGLAAGKGVILPESVEEAQTALQTMLSGVAFGEAGREVVIEEHLNGPEVTLMAFSDGMTVKPMIPSQDHKRVFDGDHGPNTGGMGAYAPVPVCPLEMVNELLRVAIHPAAEGLRQEGRPFVGVLYGGFMLTADGPRVIEFNCRFGDPETQAVLPLLESDLLEIALACAEGRLNQVDIHWRNEAAACVVLASGGYPGKYQTGYPVSGLEDERPNTFVFHAGTKQMDGKVVTAGGRVLGVSGRGADIKAALAAAYERVAAIKFEGIHYRKDIGWRAFPQRTLERTNGPERTSPVVTKVIGG